MTQGQIEMADTNQPIVCSLVILTTEHLTLETRQKLDEWCGTIDLDRKQFSRAPTLMGATDYGWLVYCPEAFTGELPVELWACMTWARKRGHSHILFDAEGGGVGDGLAVFEAITHSPLTHREARLLQVLRHTLNDMPLPDTQTGWDTFNRAAAMLGEFDPGTVTASRGDLDPERFLADPLERRDVFGELLSVVGPLVEDQPARVRDVYARAAAVMADMEQGGGEA